MWFIRTSQPAFTPLDRRVAVERENLARRAEELTRSERPLGRRILELDEIQRDAQYGQAEVERRRGENAGRRAEVAEVRERVAGQWLIRQRGGLRAKVLLADRSPAPPKPSDHPRST